MKVSIHSAELGRMMRTVKQVLNARSVTSPNVEITCADGKITLRTANESMSVRASAAAMPIGEGSVTVDGKTFAGIADRVSGETEISADGPTVTVKWAGMRTKLPALEKGVPEMKACSGQKAALDIAALSNAFSRVSHAVAVDETRTILTGVLMEGDGNEMNLVALDGFQLSRETVKYTGDAMKIVVPGAMMKVACGMAQEGTVTLETDGERIRASTDDAEVSATLLHGEFVNYARIIPTSSTTEVLLDRDEMLNALKCASAVAGGRQVVKLSFTRDGVRMACASPSADFAAEVPCEVRGADIDIAFNIKFISNAFGSLGPKAEIRMNSSVSAAVCVSPDGDGLRLVLPVRVM